MFLEFEPGAKVGDSFEGWARQWGNIGNGGWECVCVYSWIVCALSKDKMRKMNVAEHVG